MRRQWSTMCLFVWAAVIAAAPTPGLIAATVLAEDFESGVPAVGWEATVAVGDVGFAVTADESANWTSREAGRGLAAVADARWTTGPYDAALATPMLHLPEGPYAELSFLTLFETWTGLETADVDVYVATAGTWTTLARYGDAVLDEGALDGPVVLPLTAYAGEDIRLRFRYANDLAGLPAGASFFGDLYWQIDAVRVTAVELWADADASGKVDIDDFVILKNNFGLDGASWGQGDFNSDGTVDIDDFVILKNNFGAATTVPEPLAVLLLVGGASPVLRRRRRR